MAIAEMLARKHKLGSTGIPELNLRKYQTLLNHFEFQELACAKQQNRDQLEFPNRNREKTKWKLGVPETHLYKTLESGQTGIFKWHYRKVFQLFSSFCLLVCVCVVFQVPPKSQ